MLYRTFGQIGETVSVLGVGGSDIGKTSSDDLATRIISTAIDRGVNFIFCPFLLIVGRGDLGS